MDKELNEVIQETVEEIMKEPDVQIMLAEAIEQIKAEEREACAQLCEDHFSSDGNWCAMQIRARGTKCGH